MAFKVAKSRLESHFISQKGYEALTAATPEPKDFWEERASVLAAELITRCSVFL